MSEPAPPHALLRPRIALPFVVIALIWGSTWFVITGQIGGVPASWSVSYRFLIAAPAMAALALAMARTLRMPPGAHVLALVMGLLQFVGNFGLIYRAEAHLTSGIVAMMVGLMFVPNAVFGRAILGQEVTARFMTGSAVAIAGITLLLVNEARGADLGDDVALGAWLGLGAMLTASLSNVLQATRTGRGVPIVVLLAWAMLYGVALNVALAWVTDGPPAMPRDGSFWLGTAYLAVFGSLVTFPLYYRLIREIGAGRAAYHNVLVIVVAMVISTLLEGYRWSALAIAGAVLAVAGLIIALRARNA